MIDLDYLKNLENKIIKYRNNLNISNDITFGIEIEYENIKRSELSNYMTDINYFYDKYRGWSNVIELDLESYDLGLEYNGEVVSPILRDDNISWQNLKITTDLLKKYKGYVTEKCGGHVNIGAHILESNPKYYRNFFLLWTLYEKEIYQFSTGEFYRIRQSKDSVIKRIAPLLKQNINYIINEWNNEGIFNNYLYNSSSAFFDKIHDLSLCKVKDENYKYNNVIEFRIPNGTIKKEIWQNYINFFTKFLLSCKKELDVEKTIYDIKHDNHNLIDLVNFVFDDTIDKENFLIQSLKLNNKYNKNLRKHI